MTQSLSKGYMNCQTADGDSLQVHYREAGDVNNPPLLLLHQSPSSSAMYENLMAELAEKYWLLAPDTAGFGDSDWLPIFSLEGSVTLIKQFLTAKGVESCFVFGHHTGASVAVQLEADFPGTTNAMSLSGPTLLTEQQKQILPTKAAPFEQTDDGSHVNSMWQRIREKDSAVDMALTQREVLLALRCGDNYQAAYQAVCDQDFANQLISIECPVQVFAGGCDGLLSSVQPTLELLSDGYLAKAPADAGTYICDTHPVEVAVLLDNFFKHSF
jgi:haloalkane dehalogenase